MKFKSLHMEISNGITVDITGEVAVLETSKAKISITGDYCVVESQLDQDSTLELIDNLTQVMEEYIE